MKGSKVSREGPSSRVRVPKPPDFFTKKKCRRFVRRGYALRSHEGRERTTRRSPRAAADDADRRVTRRSSANASRCASVASRDAPRDVRGIPRLRSRSPKSRLGAVASERERSPETREEDALRTWTWKTAPCGWTCRFGRGGGDGTRSAPGREARATRRRATDAGMSAS